MFLEPFHAIHSPPLTQLHPGYPSTEPLKILVVEDSPGDIGFTLGLLQDFSALRFHLLQTTQLTEAFSLVASQAIAAILLDLSSSNFQALNGVMQLHRVAPDVPIIVLASQQNEAIALQALRYGAKDYLFKEQLDGYWLMRSLQQAIEHQRLQTALRQTQQALQQTTSPPPPLSYEQLENLAQERTQQLAQEKALLEAILNSIQEGICVSQPDGKIILVNSAFKQIYGLNLSTFPVHFRDCLGQIQIANPDGSYPKLKDLPIYRALQGEVFTDQEFDIRCPDGQEKRVSISGAGVLDKAGNVLFAVNTSRDITHQRQAEAALIESETKFRSIVENANDIIYSLSPDGLFLYVSPNWTHLLGHSIAEVENHSFEPFVHPEDVQACKNFLTNVIVTGEKKAGIEYRVRHKDGSWKWHTSNASAVKDANGQVLYYAGISRDITARKQSEMELLKAKDAAEIGSRSKSDFLATMSHELRTPLNAILGLSQLLEQEIFGSLNAKQQEYVACIRSSGDHLLALINDILDLSKVEAGKEELRMVPVAVAELCRYCLALLGEQAYEKNLQLLSDIDPAALVCNADERRLRQMLLNLLSNAIKFTLSGQVTLAVQKQPQGITFTVTDTGIGIAEEKLSLLFMPFSQLDSGLNRQYEGTGLGLALTRSLARMHGGDVTVESTLGQGSKFTLYLPDEPYSAMQPTMLFEGEQTGAGGGSSPTASGAFTKGKRSPLKRVLVVEDDLKSAMLVKDYLKAQNYQVEHLSNGVNFLDRVQAFQPTLILLDVQLSDQVTGMDLLRDLRSQPNLQHLPVVIMTAMAMAGDRDRFLAAGANDYLSKPLGVAQLESLLLEYFFS